MDNEFYRVSESPLAPRRRQVPKRALAIGAGLLIFAVLIFAIFSLTGNREAVSEVANEVEATCEGDQTCMNRELQSLAVERRDSRLCGQSSTDRFTNCINVYASELSDASACRDLSGEERDDCEDYVHRDLAAETGNIEYCAALHDESRRSACGERLALADATDRSCDNSGEWLSVCEERVNFELAVIESNDADFCEHWTGDEGSEGARNRALCEFYMTADDDEDGLDLAGEFSANTDPLDEDSDGDGLLDGAEVNLHGTDPLSADTDGDGFSDSEEVASGFDPLQPPTEAE